MSVTYRNKCASYIICDQVENNFQYFPFYTRITLITKYETPGGTGTDKKEKIVWEYEIEMHCAKP